MQIDFAYKLGDPVRLVDIERNGRIVGLYFCDYGKQYQVAYWQDGERNTVFVMDCEIESANKSDGVGWL